ncbi:MAG: c-type cytochrome [Verrucomicrobiae bacterium]|nr:c-type cytochrome [Verrucomicrobiae bacterium]
MRLRVSVCLLVLSLGPASDLPAQKVIPHTAEAPLPPAEAARTMTVPEGFTVTLFAGEPDLKQPTGFCLDDRGRLWVVENYSYPDHTNEPAKDRVLIFEDTDGDGRHDKRTVFYDRLNYAMGIEVGFGGAWVMSPPYFYFIPDRNGDDVPDGEPEIVLDGFGNHANSHNIANGFSWGPDGWLYGTHGRTNWSTIGRPGAAESERRRFDGGVWRYHPVRKVWEPFADGTTNPWGIDWDDYGQGFVCNCVNPHLFHVIQGAHYEPWRGRESSRFAYDRIATIADHLHYVGGNDVRAGIGSEAEDLAGGGHAHCGTMVYLGDNWPAEYRGGIFMNNIHGRRVNHDVPRRSGSGYVASHAPDLMRSADPWYMGVTLRYGAAGEVYASDWSDTGECHSTRNTRKETGRLFRVAWGDLARPPVDLARLDNAALVAAQLHPNDWHVQHARRLLHERAAAGEDMTSVNAALLAMFSENPEPARKLRALWALHVTGGANADFLTDQLGHESEYVRAWAVQLLCEGGVPPAAALDRFASMAAGDESAIVRLFLASALQRLAPENRWPIAEALVARAEDAADQNLPHLIWYGVEPLVATDAKRFAALAGRAQIPPIRGHIGRRLIDGATDAGELLTIAVTELGDLPDDAARATFLGGVLQGLEGRRQAPMPEAWPALYATLAKSPDAVLRASATRLALIFDDPAAHARLRALAADTAAGAAERSAAIDALAARRPDDLAPLLLRLLEDPAPAVRGSALRGLAEYDGAAIPGAILERFAAFDPQSRQDALQTLVSRPTWAAAALDAVEAGHLARSEITAYAARQMQSLGDKALASRVTDLWGSTRPSSAEKQKQMAELRKKLGPGDLEKGDRSAGRAVFQKTCFACHTLFGEGGRIGPDLTGAQRDNLDYLLENIVDPSASVAKDFQLNTIVTTGGRVVSGFVVDESEASLTVQSLNEKIAIPAGEVKSREASRVSMMPEGLLQILTETEVRDLFAYLSGSTREP